MATPTSAAIDITKMNPEQLKAAYEAALAENAELKKGKKAQQDLSLRVSEKGAVSVYGLGRFPVTLYKEQWIRLLDMADDVRGFIKTNDSKLKTKAEK